MIDIHITSSEVKKYIFYIVLFNAVFPKLLEESGMTIWVDDMSDTNNIHCMSYQTFIEEFDHFGLNQVAV